MYVITLKLSICMTQVNVLAEELNQLRLCFKLFLFSHKIILYLQLQFSVHSLYCCREEHISHLVYPLNTVLDDSLGCAMWFAARGKGVLYTASKALQPEVLYQSRARVSVVCEEDSKEEVRERVCVRKIAKNK